MHTAISSSRIQELVADMSPIYKLRIAEPALTSLAALERNIYAELLKSRKAGQRDIGSVRAAIHKIMRLRQVKETIIMHGRIIDRLAVDGI